MTPRYSTGQPVTCILFDGAWVVDSMVDCTYYHRYVLRQGERYEPDIPEIWLTEYRQRPHLTLAIDNDKMMAC